MKDKTKRTWLIVLGALVCVALVVAIAGRFGTPAVTDPQLTNETPDSSTPVVDINTPDKPEVIVQIDTGGTKNDKDPAAGADSNGTEQAIQADPVKPDAPEKPTPVEENHDGGDVPEAERNTETPPTYTPEQTTVKPKPQSQGGDGYLPGFGYIESSGEGTVTVNDDMYENGNKVGVMD
jgi:hypothetical protein